MTIVPTFPFPVPRGYRWLIDRKLVGFEPFSALQPWYFMSDAEAFSVTGRWSKPGGDTELLAFARRQDCDDLACFSRDSAGRIGVVVVRGWTPNGYEVAAIYESMWDWLKSVVDQIGEWVDLCEAS